MPIIDDQQELEERHKPAELVPDPPTAPDAYDEARDDAISQGIENLANGLDFVSAKIRDTFLKHVYPPKPDGVSKEEWDELLAEADQDELKDE